jgi:hypothetical protein
VGESSRPLKSRPCRGGFSLLGGCGSARPCRSKSYQEATRCGYWEGCSRVETLLPVVGGQERGSAEAIRRRSSKPARNSRRAARVTSLGVLPRLSAARRRRRCSLSGARNVVRGAIMEEEGVRHSLIIGTKKPSGISQGLKERRDFFILAKKKRRGQDGALLLLKEPR